MREIQEYLAVLRLWKHVDDSIQRFRRIVRVQRGKAQVTRACHIERRLHGLPIADFSDLNDVRG